MFYEFSFAEPIDNNQKRGHQVLSHPRMLSFYFVGFGIRQNSLVALLLGRRCGFCATPRSSDFQFQIGCNPFWNYLISL